jgi:hypothetical protein
MTESHDTSVAVSEGAESAPIEPLDDAPEHPIPEVFDDEDGDLWWIAGHVSDDEARLALLAHMLHPEWSFYERQDAYETALTAKVKRRFYKPASDEQDEERMVECAMGETNAGAFTLIEASDG